MFWEKFYKHYNFIIYMGWRNLSSKIKGLVMGVIFIILSYSSYLYQVFMNRWASLSFITKIFGLIFLLPKIVINPLLDINFRGTQHNLIVDIILIVFWITLFI